MLAKEEYVEQAYLFKSLCERTSSNEPIQDLLVKLKEELLVTTKLPMAVDFILAELNHNGTMASALRRMLHYFTHFQTFLIEEAERESGRFDILTAFAILHRESELRAKQIGCSAIFFYQFEAICRNRLRYDYGLQAMSLDPVYDEVWKKWILAARKKIEAVGLADLIYVHSEHYVAQQRRLHRDAVETPDPLLFGDQEGKIALANRNKDQTYLFSALQRQLDYPAAPKPKKRDETIDLLPRMLRQIERLEVRVKLLEEEQRESGIDLSKFMEPGKYKLPEDEDDNPS